MFNNGDKVALRESPNVLHGVVGASAHGSVVCVGSAYYWRNGRVTEHKESDDDIVPFVEDTGPKKFWIVTRNNVVTYASLEEAQRVANATAATSNNSYLVHEVVSKHEKEVPVPAVPPVIVTTYR